MTKCILVLDSIPRRRQQLIEHFLNPAGYRVLEADRSNVALTLSQECDVILACHLPLDVFSFLQAARNRGILKPVILLTSEGSEALAVKAFRQGVSDYLCEPFQIEEVLGSIHEALDKHLEQNLITNASEQLQVANHELTAYLQGLDHIIEISKTITSDLLLEDILQDVVVAAASVTQSDTASILLLDAESNDLYIRASHNLETKLAHNLRIPTNDSLAGQVIRTGQPIFINGDQDHKIKTSYLVKSLAYMPLKINDQVVGVLGVDNRFTNRPFLSSQIKLLNLLADFASIALSNASQYQVAQQERDTLNAILSGIEDVVLVIDSKGQLLICNPAAQSVFHIPANYDGMAHNIIDHDGVLHLLKVDNLLRSEVTIEDDRVFNAHLTIIPSVGRVIVMQDITHLKELDRIKTSFVANVSQDLRSPLTAILGYVELLGRAGPVNTQQQLFINRITLSAQSISNLITDLLDLSRIEAAGLELAYEQVWMGMIVDYALAAVEGEIKAKQQRMIVNMDNNALPIYGNAQRLKQMARNIVQNAILYTPDCGTISVTLSYEIDHVLLQIRDNGIGIPLEEQAHIFDKFYRAENVRDAYEGAGLGLAIVKSILDSHNGRIWVESTPNKGSTFTIILPVQAEFTAVLERAGIDAKALR